MQSASCCESWAERSWSQRAEARPSFARVGWIQREVVAAVVNSAGCVVVKRQPWARETFREEKKGKKKGNGPTVDFNFSNKEGYSGT